MRPAPPIIHTSFPGAARSRLAVLVVRAVAARGVARAEPGNRVRGPDGTGHEPGVELDALYIFRDSDSTGAQNQAFAGPGISLGLEYFVTGDIAIGARTLCTLYIAVNNNSPLRAGYGGTISAQVYF